MISEKLLVWIIVMIKFLKPGVEGQTVCSCYDFESSFKHSWQQAKDSCNYNNKTLVVMETEVEWLFIKNELKQRAPPDEWMIGLFKKMTTGNWTWVNGKPLTINKWQSHKPDENDKYALIAKEFPAGRPGSFNSITSNVQRGWICEEESVDCSGEVCWPHVLQSTTTPKAFPTNGTSFTTTTSSVVTSGQVPATTTRNNEQKDNENRDKSPVEIIAATSVAGFLLILAIALVTIYIVRRRKLPKKDAELPPSKSNQSSQKPDNQYDSIDAREAAKLLQSAEDNTYAETRKADMKKAPKVEREYANVDKSGKKQPTGDLVYAELAEFDDGNDDAKPPKPAPYEPTVYADVDQPQLRTGSNAEEHTYANFESSAV